MKKPLAIGLGAAVLIFAVFCAGAVRELSHQWRDPVFDTVPPPDPGPVEGLGVLVFSKTNGYRHASIEAGVAALERLGAERGWTAVATENGAAFHAGYLEHFDVVVWLHTTADVLTPEQQAAFEQYVESGGGYVGIHSAADTEYDWTWYGQLVGARFRAHTVWPHLPEADVVVEDREHPATAFLPPRWRRADEWYAFRDNPRPRVRVLASLDEQSYDPQRADMAGDHPIVWHHQVGAGRAFYTAIGHTEESFEEPLALRHFAAGVEWAGRRGP